MSAGVPSPLSFQASILQDLVQEDGLAILGKGMAYSSTLAFLCSLMHAPNSLVVIVNLPSEQAVRISKLVTDIGQHSLIVVDSQWTAADRAKLYASGGIISVTSRILVVDLLTKVADPKRINAMIVFNAHRIHEGSNEAFILRLFKAGHREGFVKALSDSPESMQAGFARVEKVLKALFVRRMYLWPRYHVAVSSCLDKTPPSVQQLTVPMSTFMQECQEAIVHAIKDCLVKIRSAGIDVGEPTIEEVLLKSFHNSIRKQLDSVWHTASFHMRQLVSDLKTLHQLLAHLLQYDCVSFIELLESFKAATAERSTWLLSPPAQHLFENAKHRVYNATMETSDTISGGPKQIKINPVLQPNPKWRALESVLASVSKTAEKGQSVVIFVNDKGQSLTLQDAMTYGSDKLMQHHWKRFCKSRFDMWRRRGGSTLRSDSDRILNPVQAEFKELARIGERMLREGLTADSASGQGKGGTKKKSSRANKQHFLHPVVGGGGDLPPNQGPSRSAMPKEIDEIDIVSSLAEQVKYSPMAEELGDVTYRTGIVEKLLKNGIDIQFCVCEEAEEILSHCNPNFVVVYQPDVSLIRTIETWHAGLQRNSSTRVFFLAYRKSCEELRFQGDITKEKAAFKALEARKSRMTIPSLEELYSSAATEQSSEFNPVFNSRKGRKESLQRKTKVVVDMREFRSMLPPMLYSKGLNVVPVTMTVGDYVLSPELCLERKSVSDLYGSFASGRLFLQAERMTQFYSKAALLIEFDESKSFALISASDITPDISSSSIVSKIVLLILAFPTLRFLWSASAHFTADMIASVKQIGEEPDEHLCSDLGAEDGDEVEGFQVAPQHVLRKLPGVSRSNIRQIMTKFHTLAEIADASKEDLEEVMGSKPAGELHHFLHTKAPAAV